MAGTDLMAILLLVILILVAVVGGALVVTLLAQRPRRQIASPTPIPMSFSRRQSDGGVHYRSLTPSALGPTGPRGLPTPPRTTGTRRSPRLVIESGPLRGSFYSLARPTLSIGRGNVCSIIVPDPRVSRRHLLIEWRSDGLYLFDTHSTNGTYVNGRRVGHYRLRGGEQVRVGDTLLTIRLD